MNLYLEELGTLLCLDSGVLEAGIELKDAVQAKCEQLVNNEVGARCEAMTIFFIVEAFFQSGA